MPNRVKVQEPVPEWRRPVIRETLAQAFPALGEIKEFRNKVCLFSSDRTKVYDVVSPRYQLVEHGAAVDAVTSALRRYFGESADMHMNIRTLNGGARIRGEVKLPIPPVRLGKDDVNELTLVLRNSYDRSSPFHACLGAFRLICSNGMKVGTTFGQITARHVGSAQTDLIGDGNDTILDQLDNIVKRAPMVRQLWEQWQDTPITRDLAVQQTAGWLPAMYGDPIFEEARWGKKGQRSVWEFYNDLTYMSTHRTRSMNRRMEFDDRIAALFYGGSAAPDLAPDDGE